MQSQYSNRRFIIIGTFVLIVIIYIIRLFSLQVLDASYRLSAANNAFRNVTQYPARGLIYDRNGKLLVYNEAAFDLMVVPRQVNPFDTAKFCEILDISREYVRTELAAAKSYSWYKPSVFLRQISAEKYAVFQEMLYKFSGFYVQTRTLRKYPIPVAAHVLGYVGEVNDKIVESQPYYKPGDYIGISGIEKSYEKYLRGEKGVKIFLVDVHNRIKGSYKDGKFDTMAVVGANITTSLDADLQAYGELLMQNKTGSIVAIEPHSGEILSLVSSPAYDPNLLVGRARSKNYTKLEKDSLKPLFNRALMAPYPPGSTFKPLNALIGLQEGVITTESHFTCSGGYTVGNFHLGCHHYGSIGFIYSIQGSCNAYYCNVFRRIIDNPAYNKVSEGYTAWRNHVMDFGIGKKLNTDLTHELKGFVPPPEYYDKYYGKDKWKSLWIVSLAIGQGEIGTTPLQLANMTATIANRGYYIIPHIIKDIKGDHQIPQRFKEKQFTSIDTAHFRPVIKGMELVVKSGTATRARVEGIDICGKTGTAENPHGEDHSVFIAFAPKDDPQIALAVFVENAGYGSTWAAPIASLMIEKYLNDSISRPWVEKRILDANLIEKR